MCIEVFFQTWKCRLLYYKKRTYHSLYYISFPKILLHVNESKYTPICFEMESAKLLCNIPKLEREKKEE